MSHPIIQRELLGTLRMKRSLTVLIGAAIVFAFLVISRWPGNATVELSGAQAQEVFRLFTYGLLAVLVLLVPAFPATSIVREKKRGTLTLLLNSPMSATSIFFGKATGCFFFVALLLAVSIPAAAAAYGMGGISFTAHILPLYGILLLVLLQYTTLALMVSSYATSIDSALRMTYAVVLLMALGALGPHFLLKGGEGPLPVIAEWLRCISPIPPLMDLAGHGDVGVFDLSDMSGATPRFLLITVITIFAFSILTIAQLRSFLLDRPRPQGMVTDQRPGGQRLIRRLFFLVDPHRRKKGIPFLLNPVMVKEFRTRRFGRTHWLLRLIAVSALFSLYLSYTATTGSISWGVQTIGGIMVVLQVALIVVITPSLAANLISAERESGGWDLLMMTPLSTFRILIGKLTSVLLTLSLVLFATLPGYLVMIWIHPPLRWQVWQVLICLAWLLLFSVLLSAAVSSLCRRAAMATTIAYALLGTICLGTLLFWLGRDTTFGHRTVETALVFNPTAAALNIIQMPGFEEYRLVPTNWWWMGYFCTACTLVLFVRTWQLTRPR